jgi:hypothetical protein
MDERIDQELAILQRKYPSTRRDGRWVFVPEYPLPPDWSATVIDTAFHVRDGYPGVSPYGIYVPAGLRINGHKPDSFTDPASTIPPFGGAWAMFSWEAEQWFAKADPNAGHNFLTWVDGFAKRFREGK